MRRLPAVAGLAIACSCAPASAAGLPRGDPLQRLRAEESARAAPRDSSRRAGIVWVALCSGAMLLVVLSAVQTKRPLRLPEGRAHMRRREEIGAEQVEAVETGEQEFAELGRHVATVLTTAREAAEKEAAAVLERARAYAAEIEAETAEKRSAAFATAEDVRTRADAYAEKKRQEADEAAAEALARAERQARDLAHAAEERRQELEANVERTEERLRKLVAGLRELASRLDVLVGTDALDEALQRQVAAETASAAQEA
jgi:hypothetical protein